MVLLVLATLSVLGWVGERIWRLNIPRTYTPIKCIGIVQCACVKVLLPIRFGVNLYCIIICLY